MMYLKKMFDGEKIFHLKKETEKIVSLQVITLTQQAFMSDILSQIHPSPITLWRAILIFMLFLDTFKSSG